MNIRHDLAEHFRTELEDFGTFKADACSVYAAGVDIVAVPALVINPSAQYLTVQTENQAAVQVILDLHLVANRNVPDVALDYLDDMRVAVSKALRTMNPGFRWASFGAFGGTEVGGIVYATAQMEVVALMRDSVI